MAAQQSYADLLDAALFEAGDPPDPETSGTGGEPAAKRHCSNQRADDAPQEKAAADRVCPPHPGVIHGLCIRCGAEVESPDAATSSRSTAAGAAPATTAIKHLGRNALQLTAEEASRRANETLPALLARQRLVLVLDLDHTLLNSVRESDVTEEERVLLKQYMQLQAAAVAGSAGAAGAEGSSRPSTSTAAAGAAAPGDTEAAAPATANESQEAAAGNPVAVAPAAAAAGAGSSQGVQTSPPSAEPSAPAATEQHPANGASAPPSSSAAAAADAAGSSQPVPVRCPWPLQPPLLYHLFDKFLWTKLRPGVFEFLAGADKLYELHIYTMGDKAYAGLIAKLLDPTGRLFGDRVISQADSTRQHQKDLDVTLTSDRHVIILDDTEHVWARHKGNLIQIERYHYFGSSVRAWYPLAKGHAECGTDEGGPPGPCCLSTCLRVLQQVHADFFGLSSDDSSNSSDQEAAPGASGTLQGSTEQQQLQQQQPQQQQGGLARRVVRRAPGAEGPSQRAAAQGAAGAGPSSAAVQALLQKDVRHCLTTVRAQILHGCTLVFSRCWPQSTDPWDQPLWQMAEALGADCSTRYEPDTTTHLITLPEKGASHTLPLTSKVQAAAREGKWVVHADWLLACRSNWAKVAEGPYQLPDYLNSGRCTASRWRGFGAWAGAEDMTAVARQQAKAGAGEAGSGAAVGGGTAAVEDAARALRAAGRAS